MGSEKYAYTKGVGPKSLDNFPNMFENGRQEGIGGDGVDKCARSRSDKRLVDVFIDKPSLRLPAPNLEREL